MTPAASQPETAPLSSAWSVLPPEYAIPEHPPSLAEAREYCRRLARSHYENFSVASWFLPKRLRQHFFNVYSYCRISDDLGDEVGDGAASLQLLGEWETELNACYDSYPRHPVFVALAETVRMFEIPKHEFADLLTAFRQDQSITRYETFNELLAYCRYSANPVGHLVLYLCGYQDRERQMLSDYTCTALQLANFWQDVSADFAKGRIYVPLEDLRRFGVSEEVLGAAETSAAFRAMLKFEVSRDAERVAPERAGKAMSTAVGNAHPQFSPTRSQLEMAYSVCRSIARSAAKNFYYGFVVLPQRKRNALSAVYAFMRRCDDITDDNKLTPDDRRNKLADWLDKVHYAL